jgi:hypothetical protein
MTNTRSNQSVGRGSEWMSYLNPFKVINPAIKQVPPVKWALGIAGVMAALALGLSFFHSGAPAAIIGAGVMIALMVLLRIFAYVSTNTDLRAPALCLTWTCVVLFIAAGLSIFSCVLFRWPRPYAEIVGELLQTTKTSPQVVEHQFSNQNITTDQLPPGIKK